MRYMIEPKTLNDGYTKFLEVKSFQNQLSLGKVLKQIIFRWCPSESENFLKGWLRLLDLKRRVRNQRKTTETNQHQKTVTKKVFLYSLKMLESDTVKVKFILFLEAGSV